MALNDFYRGDTKKIKFNFTDNTDPQNPVVVDITGWEIWFTLKHDIDVSDYNADAQVKHIVGSDPSDDPVNGFAILTLTPSDTSGLAVGEYHYDIQRVIPGVTPDVRTVDKGLVNVLQDVTINIS